MVFEHVRSHCKVLCRARGLDQYLRQGMEAGYCPSPNTVARHHLNNRIMYYQITLNYHRLSVILFSSPVPTLHLCDNIRGTGDQYPNTPATNNSPLSKVKVNFWDNRLSTAGTKVDN